MAFLGSSLAVDIGSQKQPVNSVAPGLSNRAARLFFVSTTTSTLSTTTVCYYTGTSAITTTCSGKRKRAIFTNPDTGADALLEIAPKRVEREVLAEVEEEFEAAVEKFWLR